MEEEASPLAAITDKVKEVVLTEEKKDEGE
jgi:hypothetical protein